MGYGSISAYAPSGYDVFLEIASFVIAMGAVAFGYLVANKFGYTNYLALIIAGIATVFYLLTGLPDTATILMYALFGIGEVIGSHGFILNPTLIGSGGGA
jgi:hypothetical protein